MCPRRGQVPCEVQSVKILFLSQGYPPTNRCYGVSTYTPETARGLAALGHEVHVLDCLPTYRPHDELDGPVIVHRRRTFRVRGTWLLLRMLPGGLGHRLLRRTKGYRPDRVLRRLNEAVSYYVHARRLGIHFDVLQAPNGSLGLVFALLRSHPLVVNLHCPPLFEPAHDGGNRGWRASVADSL